MFNTMLKDNVKACELLSDGSYKRIKNKLPELNLSLIHISYGSRIRLYIYIESQALKIVAKGIDQTWSIPFIYA